MSGQSFCRPVVKIDRVPTPLPSDDTLTPSGGRFGNLRAKKMSSPAQTPTEDEQGSRFKRNNMPSATSLTSLVDSPVEESRFSRLRSRPSEGSFQIDGEGRDFRGLRKSSTPIPAEELVEGRSFGALRSSNSAPKIDEIIDEPSRFTGTLKSGNSSAFDMRRDRKPVREDQNRKLVVNESSNFILKNIAERQRREEVAATPIFKRNALTELVMIAAQTVDIEEPKPKPKKQEKKSKNKNVSLDDLDDDRPITNVSKIAEQYGQIEAEDSDNEDDNSGTLTAKELKKMRRLEKVEARGGPTNHFI